MEKAIVALYDYYTVSIKINAIPIENNPWFTDIKFLLGEDDNNNNSDVIVELYEILCEKINIQPYNKNIIAESIRKLESDNYRNNVIIEVLGPICNISKDTSDSIKNDISDKLESIKKLKKYIT